MKKLLTYLLSFLGLATACGQQNFENKDVKGFAELVADSNVVVLDVRTAEEFGEGHLDRALNIDVMQGDFLEKAKQILPADKKIAVYCRSGRRSANACAKLAAEGYQVVNLKGGILAWTDENMPTTTR
ncbi:MAG: rhodanese-like domain-containing protein [Prevotella sp.]|nr:rhodanese-like domain-containing protein [Prevotella sp.]